MTVDKSDLLRRDLWRAVDRLTASSTMRINRDARGDAEWLQHFADDPTLTVCDVAAYRAAIRNYGEIPSLWVQAEHALTTGTETTEGGGVPLRERSPADLDLMEDMLTIREQLRGMLATRRLTPRASVPLQMRQLAAHVAGHEPDQLDMWRWTFETWARLIEKRVHAVESPPKPVRLRNAPCPECDTRQVTILQDGEKIVAPPILIDFTDGWIRAATCTACMATWWRGDDLGRLADLLDTPSVA